MRSGTYRTSSYNISTPPDSSVEDLETIMTQLIDTADLLNVGL